MFPTRRETAMGRHIFAPCRNCRGAVSLLYYSFSTRSGNRRFTKKGSRSFPPRQNGILHPPFAIKMTEQATVRRISP